MKKVSVSKCAVRGVDHWRVRWHDAETGKPKRKFFTSLKTADNHAAELRGEAVGVRQLLSTIPQLEQEKLVMVYREAQRRGCDVLTFLHQRAANDSQAEAPFLSKVIEELVGVKTRAGRDRRYTDGLKNILDDFANGLTEMPINKIGLVEIEKWLDSKNIVSRANYRGRLSTLFNFAVRRDYIIKNPCTRLEAITVVREKPHVFTVDETKKCLNWLLKNPRLLGWFVLSTFAGLRPEEAEKTTWKDINFEEGWIKVEAQTTKTRQRRVVYPLPMVFEWLKKAKALHSGLPIGRWERKNVVAELRGVLGWAAWKKDVTRHTAASMWLAHCGSSDTVINALGHSEAMLHTHYKALTTKVDAEKFWKLTPKGVKKAV